MYRHPMAQVAHRKQVKKTRISYAIALALLIALIVTIVVSTAAHRRDVAEIDRLKQANQSLEVENKQLHNINKTIGDERNEAIKWLESIQPGINFDGI